MGASINWPKNAAKTEKFRKCVGLLLYWKIYSNFILQNQRAINSFSMRNISKTLTLTICFWISSGLSNAASYDEHSLKAAFLYNFADFITWPIASNNKPLSYINYCVLQDGLVQDSLSSLIDSDRDAKIERSFSLLSSLDQIATCHLLYLDTDDLAKNPDLLKITLGLPILTVSDHDGFLEKGGMVKLAREQNRMRVHLNVDKLTGYDFRVSSQLMRLATIYSLDDSSEVTK